MIFVIRYLVKYDVCQLPQLFIVAKNKSVLWYGDITSKGVEVRTVSRLSMATRVIITVSPTRCDVLCF